MHVVCVIEKSMCTKDLILKQRFTIKTLWTEQGTSHFRTVTLPIMIRAVTCPVLTWVARCSRLLLWQQVQKIPELYFNIFRSGRQRFVKCVLCFVETISTDQKTVGLLRSTISLTVDIFKSLYVHWNQLHIVDGCLLYGQVIKGTFCIRAATLLSDSAQTDELTRD
jgi:hypothetical protein